MIIQSLKTKIAIQSALMLKQTCFVIMFLFEKNYLASFRSAPFKILKILKLIRLCQEDYKRKEFSNLFSFDYLPCCDNHIEPQNIPINEPAITCSFVWYFNIFFYRYATIRTKKVEK
ncbi:hypothetical protein BpHYR1_008001 [Brachionus plicatilis]|uniref:Uncharacterized protein n=1 Tax=Brachionus plicatilis TaxID=10195 RepID=A0A3M7R383_BRAPC|nr:hypothetical protein BpHYR1_008001 [Brachionus plicatilis]